MAIIAFRTDEHLEEKLLQAARDEKKTKTEVIRAALELYLSQRDAGRTIPKTKQRSAVEVLQADIGVWDGPEDASADTGRQLRAILDEKHKSRRV